MDDTSTKAEEIIDPGLPIIDAHHHLWKLPEAALAAIDKPTNLVPVMRKAANYLFEDILRDVNSGHNIKATVFVEGHAMYRSKGPDEYKSLGEVEYVTGVAAMADSGLFGDRKICAGIVGLVNLLQGDSVEDILLAHIVAGGGRYRGVRVNAMYDADTEIASSWGRGPLPSGLLYDAKFRAGVKRLQKLSLSLDVLVLEPQLSDLVDLARYFPDVRFILNHLGVPLGMASYSGRFEERFRVWRRSIRELAGCENVVVKVGGLGMPFAGLPSFGLTSRASSEQLAIEWKPYVESCIEAFGASRCMFESNYPVDSGTATYAIIWNTFKRLTHGASAAEMTQLFYQTAADIYKLDVPTIGTVG